MKDELKRALSKEDFVCALYHGEPMRQWRIHAELPDGRIGITAWYHSEETLAAFLKEIKDHGHRVIKIERKVE